MKKNNARYLASDVVTAKDGSTVSLNDLQSQINALAADDSRFNVKPDRATNFCSNPWCVDVIQDGDEWKAVISACDGKLYEVGFTVAGGSATLSEDGETEVVRKTNYVAASEKGLCFNGELVQAAGTSESVKKGWESRRRKSGNELAQNHPDRWQHHSYANDIGEDGKYKPGRTKFHYVASRSDVIHHDVSPEEAERITHEHNSKLEAIKAVEPENDSEICICRDAGSPLAAEKKWEFGKPVEFMWLPGGKNVVQAGCAGRTLRVWTLADKSSAAAVQASFSAAVKTSPRRPPFGCIEHREEEKAYEPQKFSWKDDPEPGIFCTGVPTKLGEANVNGRLQTSFSPCFRHDGKLSTTVCESCEEPYAKCKCDGVLYFPEGVRGSESNPAHIIGVSEKSVGSLTNWPAFKDILPVTAKEPDANKKNTTPEKKNVSEVMEHATLAFRHGALAEHFPAEKAHATAASSEAEAASKTVEHVKDGDKGEAHHWAAKAHECAGRACCCGDCGSQGWQQEQHHRNQAELHRRYARAAKDDKHLEHSRAMNFKASEPSKPTLEDIYGRNNKPAAQPKPTMDQIYAKKGVAVSPAV